MGMGSGRGTGGDSSASNGTISISGGTVVIHASGDGMDANGSLTISGGLVTIVGPTRGDTSILDYDTTAAISGGTFIGTGASGMGQTFGDSEQAVVTLRLEEQAAGTEVSLQDPDGNVPHFHRSRPVIFHDYFQQSGFERRGNLSGDGWRDGF